MFPILAVTAKHMSKISLTESQYDYSGVQGIFDSEILINFT